MCVCILKYHILLFIYWIKSNINNNINKEEKKIPSFFFLNTKRRRRLEECKTKIYIIIIKTIHSLFLTREAKPKTIEINLLLIIY